MPGKGGKGFGSAPCQTPNKIFVSQHPLSFVNSEDIPEILQQTGAAASLRYRELLQEAISLIRASEPFQLLSTLASHGLTVGISDDGRQRRLISDEDFGQQHVELVHALSLSIGASKFQGEILDSSHVQRLFDILPKLGKTYGLHRLASTDDSRSGQDKSIKLLQEYLRLHTQSIRNWGFMSDVIAIVSDLLGPLDSRFEATTGIPGTALVEAFRILVAEIESSLDEWRQELSQVFAQKSISGMIQTYLASTQNPAEQERSISDYITKNNLSKMQVKVLIQQHRSLMLVEVYSIAAKELAARLNLLPSAIEKVFDSLSLSFGDLLYLHDDEKIAYLFLDNPAWTKPLIKMGTGNYFCPTPQMFFSFIFPILGNLCSADSGLKTAYEDRRSEFLEDRVAALFREALPGSTVIPGFKWLEGNDEYENDLIIQFDSTVILVEAKSGSVSWPALRGAPERAKRHIQELLYEPSRQSERLAAHLELCIGRADISLSPVASIPLDTSRIRRIIRLSVTLEDFATLQSNLQLVKQTGWIPEDHELAPCIALADLRIVVDMLVSPGRILHYLTVRSEIERLFSYTGDELDILGLYLSSKINSFIGASTEAHLMISGMSKDVDDYYTCLHAGVPSLSKPVLNQTRWFRDIERKAEGLCSYTWTEITNIVLGCSVEEQDKLQKMFRWIVKNVRKYRVNPCHQCSAVLPPYQIRRSAVLFYAFHSEDAESRHERMNELASQVFAQHVCISCLVVGVAIDRNDYPYSTLALLSNQDPDSMLSDDSHANNKMQKAGTAAGAAMNTHDNDTFTNPRMT